MYNLQLPYGCHGHGGHGDHGDHGGRGGCVGHGNPVGHGGRGGHLNLTVQVTCGLFSSIGCAISGVSVCFNGALDYVESQGHIQGN